MAHATLFINDTYVPDLESLRSLVKTNQKDKSFRMELLTLFSDKIIEKWFEERKIPFVVCDYDSHSTLDCFKALYLAIVGEPCSSDLTSKINEYVELDRVSFGGNHYPVSSQNVYIPNTDNDSKLLFVFRQQGSNEVFHLSLKKNGESLCKKDLSLDQLIGTHTECSVEFEIKKSWMGEELELVENDTNVLCQITFEPQVRLEIHSNVVNGSLLLYKIPDTDYWMTEIIKPGHPQLDRIVLPHDIGTFTFSTLDVDNIRKALDRNYFVGFECPKEAVVEKARETMHLDSAFKNYSLLLVYSYPDEKRYSARVVGKYASDNDYATVFVVSDTQVMRYIEFCKK